MKKKEVKQWLRSQINSSLKIQSKYNKNIFELCYNKNYLRALKLSTITGKTVNKKDFKVGESLFYFDNENQTFTYYPKIWNYLYYNYSNDYYKRIIITEEVLNEYPKYKNYNHK